MNSQNITFTQPDFLQTGDTILIVAPAGIIKQPQAIITAKETFESWGYTVIIDDTVFNEHYHFAGTDTQRLKSMQWALNHKTAKAIWCARGGYGSVRIIDDLDFYQFAKHPKWIIGYSDITVFHNKLHNLGFQSLHAPMPINFKEPWPAIQQSIEQLHNFLQGKITTYTVPSNKYNKKGTCSGVLIGGNLTILENMIGTNTCYSAKNKILFIEEIGEYKYHIDRLLRALDRKGYFKECSGLILGDFTDTKQNYPEFGQTIEELVLTIVSKYNIPVLFDFPAGHEDRNMSLIFGHSIELNVGKTVSKVKFTK
ncbi:muramoyltetrapeptide carboxypeptidase [Wenyingzhuangia heitensis]|uniref:Muramoyltetrapeptide carboxypeptidase n=1 Tax=Wenyingzhuangia heitensis TaxID=1487859 RepID=A0ABX0U7S9_9FLAO|nr:LD-carboxypeptidase [Wenyingzhuangia heitensis]NIJ43810.1 muramoyltetrapeptide carboxypeptidase [Wenyingzhuangia heitensis]